MSPHIIFHSPRVFLLTIPLLFSTGREFTSKMTVCPSHSATVDEFDFDFYVKFLLPTTYNNRARLLSIRNQIDRYILTDSECRTSTIDTRTHSLNRLLKFFFLQFFVKVRNLEVENFIFFSFIFHLQQSCSSVRSTQSTFPSHIRSE